MYRTRAMKAQDGTMRLFADVPTAAMLAQQGAEVIHDTQPQTVLDGLYRKAGKAEPGAIDPAVVEALNDDLNTPLALSRLSAIGDPSSLKASANLLGLLMAGEDEWFRGEGDSGDIDARIDARAEAKARRDFAEADRIRDELKSEGILLEDGPSGTTWRRA